MQERRMNVKCLKWVESVVLLGFLGWGKLGIRKGDLEECQTI